MKKFNDLATIGRATLKANPNREDIDMNTEKETLVLPEEYTDHAALINKLVKSPQQILQEFTPVDMDITHATLGLYDECAELLEAMLYSDDPDQSIIEELGDIEFYWFVFQTRLGFGVAMGHTEEEVDALEINDLWENFPIVTNNMLVMVKKLVIYRDETILAKLVSDAHMWRAYINRFYEEYSYTVEEAKRHNIDKLAKRYPLDNYSNEHAQKRLDKN